MRWSETKAYRLSQADILDLAAEVLSDYDYAEMRFSGGFFVDDDGYPTQPPFEGAGGLDHVISEAILVPAYSYACKYCGKQIRFKNRKAFNFPLWTPHMCLTEVKNDP